MGDASKLEALASALNDARVAMRTLETVHASLRAMHAECGWPDAYETVLDAHAEFVRAARVTYRVALERYEEEVRRG